MSVIEKIVSDMDSADNWDDLERIFIDEERHSFFNESFRGLENNWCYRYEFTLLLGSLYGSLKPNKIKIINNPLPGIIIDSKETRYIIYGVVHDEFHKDVIRNALFDKENLICEALLKSKYQLLKSKSQSKLDEIKFCNQRDYHLNYLRIKKPRDGLKKYSPIKGQVDLNGFYQDHQYQIKNKNYDLRFVNYPPHLEDKLFEYKLGKRDSRVLFLRSLSQALFIKNFAKKNNLKEVYGLYGLYHENDLACLLRDKGKFDKLIDSFGANPFFNKIKTVTLALIANAGIACPMYLAQIGNPIGYYTLPLVIPSTFLSLLFSSILISR